MSPRASCFCSREFLARATRGWRRGWRPGRGASSVRLLLSSVRRHAHWVSVTYDARDTIMLSPRSPATSVRCTRCNTVPAASTRAPRSRSDLRAFPIFPSVLPAYYVTVV
ncbi:hypothetical protein DFH09DRAFT_1325837 [Mycena vulgaris]|nr:hypothetical protein DFH09DRAFT_1325837 [Mycena vulgaris]